MTIRAGVEHIRSPAFALTRESFVRSARGTLERRRVESRLNVGDFRRLVEDLGEVLVPVLVAEHEGTLQSAAIIPFSQHSAYHMHGGSIAKPMTGASNLLQWEAMRTFADLGCTPLRFRRPRGSRARLQGRGIVRFKERFGGTFHTGWMWKVPLSCSRFALYQLAAWMRNGGDVVDQERRRARARERSHAVDPTGPRLDTHSMKQVIQNFKTGELSIADVPAPALARGFVLVRNAFSLISAGTERSTVTTAQASLLGKARQRPDLVKQVLDSLKRDGLADTLARVRTKLEALKELGYSSAGTVLASMDTDGRFKAGDRVACGLGGRVTRGHHHRAAEPRGQGPRRCGAGCGRVHHAGCDCHAGRPPGQPKTWRVCGASSGWPCSARLRATFCGRTGARCSGSTPRRLPWHWPPGPAATPREPGPIPRSGRRSGPSPAAEASTR